MPLPASVDFDKILRPTLDVVARSIHDWLDGQPHDETAFLNQLTGKLNRRPRRCDVGLDQPMEVESQLSMLHRKGPNQTDLYGSDLAVTVSIEPRVFLKTALFQLKKCTRFNVTVETRQFQDAMRDPRTRDRAFILAVEQSRPAVRIMALSDLAPSMVAANSSKDFDATSWHALTEWLLKWFECTIGASSIGDPSGGPEPLLKPFAIPAPLAGFGSGIVGGAQPDLLPARAWLQYRIYPAEGRYR